MHNGEEEINEREEEQEVKRRKVETKEGEDKEEREGEEKPPVVIVSDPGLLTKEGKKKEKEKKEKIILLPAPAPPVIILPEPPKPLITPSGIRFMPVSSLHEMEKWGFGYVTNFLEENPNATADEIFTEIIPEHMIIEIKRNNEALIKRLNDKEIFFDIMAKARNNGRPYPPDHILGTDSGDFVLNLEEGGPMKHSKAAIDLLGFEVKYGGYLTEANSLTFMKFLFYQFLMTENCENRDYLKEEFDYDCNTEKLEGTEYEPPPPQVSNLAQILSFRPHSKSKVLEFLISNIDPVNFVNSFAVNISHLSVFNLFITVLSMLTPCAPIECQSTAALKFRQQFEPVFWGTDPKLSIAFAEWLEAGNFVEVFRDVFFGTTKQFVCRSDKRTTRQRRICTLENLKALMLYVISIQISHLSNPDQELHSFPMLILDEFTEESAIRSFVRQVFLNEDQKVFLEGTLILKGLIKYDWKNHQNLQSVPLSGCPIPDTLDSDTQTHLGTSSGDYCLADLDIVDNNGIHTNNEQQTKTTENEDETNKQPDTSSEEEDSGPNQLKIFQEQYEREKKENGNEKMDEEKKEDKNEKRDLIELYLEYQHSKRKRRKLLDKKKNLNRKPSSLFQRFYKDQVKNEPEIFSLELLAAIEENLEALINRLNGNTPLLIKLHTLDFFVLVLNHFLSIFVSLPHRQHFFKSLNKYHFWDYLLDLFFERTLCNVLHNSILAVLRSVFLNPAQIELKCQILTENHLVDRIIKADKENKVHCETKISNTLGNYGHIVELTSVILNVAKKDQPVNSILVENAEWREYVVGSFLKAHTAQKLDAQSNLLWGKEKALQLATEARQKRFNACLQSLPDPPSSPRSQSTAPSPAPRPAKEMVKEEEGNALDALD